MLGSVSVRIYAKEVSGVESCGVVLFLPFGVSNYFSHIDSIYTILGFKLLFPGRFPKDKVLGAFTCFPMDKETSAIHECSNSTFEFNTFSTLFNA